MHPCFCKPGREFSHRLSTTSDSYSTPNGKARRKTSPRLKRRRPSVSTQPNAAPSKNRREEKQRLGNSRRIGREQRLRQRPQREGGVEGPGHVGLLRQLLRVDMLVLEDRQDEASAGVAQQAHEREVGLGGGFVLEEEDWDNGDGSYAQPTRRFIYNLQQIRHDTQPKRRPMFTVSLTTYHSRVNKVMSLISLQLAAA